MEQKRRRGRPPAYDRAKAVAAAQQLFWKHGASGVSVDQLSAATGLHKPSLYAAFGGRSGLYLAALDAYIDHGAPDVSGALAHRPLTKALDRFFDADLSVFCAGGEARGCFLIGTAIDAAAADASVRGRVDAIFAGLRETLRARVERAAEEGDLSDADVDSLAEVIFATHCMLAMEARAGCAAAELRRRYRRIVALIGTMRPPAKARG